MSINVVVLVGNLTRDPELKDARGTAVCSMRMAVNDRVKDPNTGEWGNRPNYFDVDVFGARGENCAKYLTKGAKITVRGRLRWREWETQEGGKRQAVSVVGDDVEFPSRAESEQSGGGYAKPAAPPQQDYREQARKDTDETFGGGGGEAGDDDIPF